MEHARNERFPNRFRGCFWKRFPLLKMKIKPRGQSPARAVCGGQGAQGGRLASAPCHAEAVGAGPGSRMRPVRSQRGGNAEGKPMYREKREKREKRASPHPPTAPGLGLLLEKNHSFGCTEGLFLFFPIVLANATV